MKMMKYEALISGKWSAVSADKLLFFLLPLGICMAYRGYRDDGEQVNVVVAETNGVPISIGEIR